MIAAAVIDFLKGLFIEPLSLLLLVAASMLGGLFFGGHLGSATVTQLIQMLVFFAGYALFVPFYARALVQGWVGMFARHIPSRFASRGENLGRGIADLAGSLLVIGGILFGNHSKHMPRVEEALGEAFAMWVVTLFGLGISIPRFYFAFARPHRTSRPQPGAPGWRRRAWPFVRRERTANAGKPRDLLDDLAVDAGVFFYLMFLGIGIGLAAAHAVAPFTHGDTLRAGTLCRHASKQNHYCQSKNAITITADRAGPIHLVYSANPLGASADPICNLTTDTGTPITEHRLTFEARAGVRYTYRVALPPRTPRGRCSYQLELDQPPDPEEAPSP